MGAALVVVVAVLALAAGISTIVVRDDFSAAVSFIAYGLALALIWMSLAGPDVALTEAALGAGLTGGVMIAASRRLKPGEQPRVGRAVRWIAGALSAAVAAALAVAILALPVPAPTLAPEALEKLAPTGLGNPITGVLLSYRGTDTLLEKVVLIVALLGVWSLAPDATWGGRPGQRQPRERGSALTLLGRVLPPLGIVVGWHILWVGADAPGGAFQGGSILAAMWVLAMMAGLIDAPVVGRRWLRWLVVLGPVVFLVVGFAGFATAGAFLAYPGGWAKPLILLIEVALTVSVAAISLLLVAGPAEREASS